MFFYSQTGKKGLTFTICCAGRHSYAHISYCFVLYNWITNEIPICWVQWSAAIHNWWKRKYNSQYWLYPSNVYIYTTWHTANRSWTIWLCGIFLPTCSQILAYKSNKLSRLSAQIEFDINLNSFFQPFFIQNDVEFSLNYIF